MFNVLISADGTAWESSGRMTILSERALEHSGAESEAISLDEPATFKALERVTSLLLYEDGASADTVRVGQLRDIRVGRTRITFRFSETGRLPPERFAECRPRLQISEWEMRRTHWAVKDGDIPQDVMTHVVATPRQYDIVLSFAGEDRPYVENVAAFLDERDVAVFYDGYEATTLWGKDLPEHFDSVYRRQGRFCVMFISRHYAENVWTRHERRSALARALEERAEYVLPARFDDTEIDGLRPTIGYLDLRTMSAEELGTAILQKLGRP
jgi:hypothetical protein